MGEHQTRTRGIPPAQAARSLLSAEKPTPVESLWRSNVGGARLSGARIVRLQRTVGNQQVQRLLSGPRSVVAVQRYEAGEHAQFGGGLEFRLTQKKIKDNSGKDVALPPLSEGDIIALGDFYGSPDEILAADPEELNKLVQLIHRDRDYFEKKIGKPVGTDEWQSATMGRHEGKRYLDLAGKNAAHFAAPSGSTGFASGDADNRSMWFKHFSAAIKQSQQNKLDQALLTNAFAAHFLTDAFSAGHLINKEEAIAKTKKSPAATNKQRTADPRMSDAATKADFEHRVATGILSDPRGAELYQYEAKTSAIMGRWHPMSVDTLAGVIDVIEYWKTDKFYSMFVRSVHDRLNSAITTSSGGVEVANKAGETWTLSGDATLANSPKTLEVARRAVALSREAVTDAQGKARVDLNAIAQRVWDLVPVPTSKGQADVDTAQAELIDPKQTAASDAWISVALDAENFATLKKELVTNKLLRRAPAPKPAPAQTTAPTSN